MFLILFCVLLSVLFAESLYFRICEIIPQIVFSDGSFSEPAFIFLQPLFDLSVNALAVQLILVQQCNCRAGLSEYILYADAQYRSRCFLRKCLANCSTKSADDGMLLYGYDFSGCLCCRYDKLFIERFDRVDVDDLCRNAILCKHLGSFQCSCLRKDRLQ